LARKILLADDSVTAQNMGRKILADAGYEVITVNNGSAALKRVSETAPDLIILDVYMPGYSGLEVCQRLKETAETADIPVLLSVGKLEPFKPQEARRVRADAHIVKPFEASQLLSAIAQLEDQMVPQQHKPGRFASSSAGTIDEAYGREESRILGRVAKSQKKKETGDSGISSQAAAFRDFRKKAKSQPQAPGASDLSAENTEELAPKPGPLAEIPRDITPEELSALSEVAAKLHEPALAQPSGEAAAPAPESHEASPAQEPVATPLAEVRYAEPAEEPAPAIDAVAPPVLAKNQIEIPAAAVEPASEVSSVAPPAPLEGAAESVESFRVPEFQMPEPVSAASFTEESAPVDQQEEPMFASAVAQEPAAPAPTAPVSEPPAIAASEKADAADKAEESSSLDSSFAQAAFAESGASESSAAEFCAVEGPVSESISAEASQAEKTVEPEAPMPTEAELAEALRLLTPAPTHAEPPAEPVPATAHWSEEATMELPAAKRWVAQAMELTPEEASFSLEAEMFRAFTAKAEQLETVSAEDPLVSIQAAVEKRIAEEVGREPADEAAARAMAAAAPNGSTPSTEAAEIASIVDKVMADLRPKIVEEIARKLSGK
jgi:CheY-like chemotaxis protein